MNTQQKLSAHLNALASQGPNEVTDYLCTEIDELVAAVETLLWRVEDLERYSHDHGSK